MRVTSKADDENLRIPLGSVTHFSSQSLLRWAQGIWIEHPQVPTLEGPHEPSDRHTGQKVPARQPVGRSGAAS